MPILKYVINDNNPVLKYYIVVMMLMACLKKFKCVSANAASLIAADFTITLCVSMK